MKDLTEVEILSFLRKDIDQLKKKKNRTEDEQWYLDFLIKHGEVQTQKEKTHDKHSPSNSNRKRPNPSIHKP